MRFYIFSFTAMSIWHCWGCSWKIKGKTETPHEYMQPKQHFNLMEYTNVILVKSTYAAYIIR